jgi:acyl-CoA synthetase (AMP-forming)/AMP-acid ligase II/lauroyl/myristoyl acyltransferase/acyl carrier protein
MDIDRSEIEGDLPDRFRRLVAALPEREAVRHGGESITFAGLDSESDRVAALLLDRGDPPAGPVAILLDPGIPAILAVLGIIKAGRMFVPFLTESHPRSTAALWENAARPPILTDAEHRDLAASIAGDERTVVDVRERPAHPFDPASIRCTPDTLAMLTYSSGTTSAPKGTASTHRMILHSTWFYFHCHGYSEGDRITYLSVFNSSAAVSYNLYTILCGATLVFPPVQSAHSPMYLDWLRREKITVLSITALPQFQEYLRAAGERVSLPDLREVSIGGQQITRAEMEELRRRLPEQVVYFHRLASSDLNQISELKIPPGSGIPWEQIPVGESVPGKEILLLDDARRRVPPGEIGEIAVRSRYLPPGYWRLPELTRRKYIADPEGGEEKVFLTGDVGRILPDGNLEFHGRKDNLIRIRNQNVQLEEIVMHLLQVPGVGEASVQVTPWGEGDKRLTAYIVMQPGDPPTVDAIRRDLMGHLPPHMIPASYVFLESLPVLAPGKVDRGALPLPSTDRPRLSIPYRGPEDAIEERLCSLWSRILHVAPVGADDDFYDLGGDSLLVLTMTLEVEQEFQRSIPQAYYRSVTVAGLARIWREQDRGGIPEDESSHAFPPALTGSGSGSTRFSAGSAGKQAAKPSARPNFGISAASLVVSHLPYRAGVRLAALACSFPPMRRMFLRRHIRLFRDFRASLGGCPEAPPDAELISLSGNLLWSAHLRAGLGDLADLDILEGMRRSRARYWRDLGRIIDRAGSEEFEWLFPVEGWKHLERAYTAGRGVVLVTLHSTASHVASAAIYRRLNARPIQTISRKRAQRIERLRGDELPWNAPIDDATLTSDLLIRGYQTLKQGEIIQLVPDGLAFSVQDEAVNVAGRSVYIQSGFAKIGLLADAAIIPVLTTRRLDGGFRFTFFPPLAPSDPRAPLEGKILDLVRQFAAFLERGWKRAPECVTWPKMKKYLHWPALD